MARGTGSIHKRKGSICGTRTHTFLPARHRQPLAYHMHTTMLKSMDGSSGKSSRCKHTEAVLSWMLQPSKLATPSWVTMTPPPCKSRKSEVKLHECYGTLHACGSECKHSHAATLKATSTAQPVSSMGRSGGLTFRESSRWEHTWRTVLSWMLQPSKFATPLFWT